jgi:hypothetical protein
VKSSQNYVFTCSVSITVNRQVLKTSNGTGTSTPSKPRGSDGPNYVMIVVVIFITMPVLLLLVIFFRRVLRTKPYKVYNEIQKPEDETNPCAICLSSLSRGVLVITGCRYVMQLSQSPISQAVPRPVATASDGLPIVQEPSSMSYYST